MLFGQHLCLLRGGGDLATGVALRLHRSGFPVAVCELTHPLAVRRTVAVASALLDPEGEALIEGMGARRVEGVDEMQELAANGVVPVLASSDLPPVAQIARSVVIDARLLKRNPDTAIEDAPLVVALGPGYTAGIDCHAVVETLRGPDLGRVIYKGCAANDTGTPGTVGGRSAERVLRAPTNGVASWERTIGDRVTTGEVLGSVGTTPVTALIDGTIRGLIANGTPVASGTKVGDVDPRGDEVDIDRVSDKALAVGGGVLEAVLAWVGSED
ncbi:MAG TPA: molybdenum hydroxylase [Acidimicrobiaceae bacterium]|nr:molybdenum hydroxylase [Acidimicrobiaceae bacterium]